MDLHLSLQNLMLPQKESHPAVILLLHLCLSSKTRQFLTLSCCQSPLMWGMAVSPSHSLTGLQFPSGMRKHLVKPMCAATGSHVNSAVYKIWQCKIFLCFWQRVNLLFPLQFRLSCNAVESLTADRLVLGAALRDVVAEHCADSWVCSEAPWEFLSIWIPAVVFSEVSGNHKESHPVICMEISACRWVSVWMTAWLTCRGRIQVWMCDYVDTGSPSVGMWVQWAEGPLCPYNHFLCPGNTQLFPPRCF